MQLNMLHLLDARRQEGDLHILVVIDDKKTGKRVDKADVRVTFVGRLGPETVRLQPMTMNNFAGFGEFVRLGSARPYVFNVSFRLSGKEPVKEARFALQSPSSKGEISEGYRKRGES